MLHFNRNNIALHNHLQSNRSRSLVRSANQSNPQPTTGAVNFGIARRGFTREEYELLPPRIVVIRHGESVGNISRDTYSSLPDNLVPLTEKGHEEARAAGRKLRSKLIKLHEKDGSEMKVFCMTSPYRRTMETTDGLIEAFKDDEVTGLRSAVQLREQDFGNFQTPSKINADMEERNRFGRFWFRFPNGESGSDVYDRMTIFTDHLVRDMGLGRFSSQSLILVTHGLTLRILLMRWFHWSVYQFLEVFNPQNCDPVIIEKLPWDKVEAMQSTTKRLYVHVKQVYVIDEESASKLKGVTPEMARARESELDAKESPKQRWIRMRAAMVECGSECCELDTSSQEPDEVSHGKGCDPELSPALRTEDDEPFWFRGRLRSVVDD